MFKDVTVIGAGRAGSAIAARLRERGVAVRADGELRLLCVPDRAIAEVAQSIEPGPWVAHVSGGTPLAALAPHTRRFSVHPLQTLVRRRGARAARRRLGRRDGRGRRGPRARGVARADARPAAVPARRPRAGELPRGRGDRLELPGHAVPRRRGALRAGGRSAGGSRPAARADDRERLRADRAGGARRLGDGRAPSRGAARDGLRAGLRRARGGHNRLLDGADQARCRLRAERDRAEGGRDDRGARPAPARRRRARADDGRAARGARRALPRRAARVRRARRVPVRQPGAVLRRRRSRRLPA